MTIQLPPGPKAEGIAGHARYMTENQLGFQLDAMKTYGDVVRLRFYNRVAYQISNPDDVHKVLVEENDKFSKSPIYKILLSRFLGNGLLTSNGKFWRRQRRLVQPAFHHKRIQAYATTMTNYSADMANTWKDGEVRDLNQDMMRLTLNIVAKTLFDVEVTEHASAVGDALTVLLVETTNATQGMIFVPAWVPTAANRRSKRAVAQLDSVVNHIIDERRASGEDKGDLLSMLLLTQDENGESMTNRQIRDEAVTIFLAGHETTANAMTWTWYLLSQHPEVEAKLHEEWTRVLGNRAPELQDLRQLEYTEMVIKESMRLYPPIPFIQRQALEDTTLGGYDVPKGTLVNIGPYLLHHDARWFPDPERFNPERWTKEFEKQLPKSAYIPFANGPRVCIGNSFAMMEAQIILATLGQRYQLRPVSAEAPIPEPHLTLRPKDGIRMRLEARQVRSVPDARPVATELA
ncbi:MAG TPA: cytochrome P450 [Aggregatilineales bacterium]|nr:cytochrome P450 [Aggregatilineales bacterium]